MRASVGRPAIGAQWALAYKAHNVSAFLYPVFAISPRYLTSSLLLYTSSRASVQLLQQPVICADNNCLCLLTACVMDAQLHVQKHYLYENAVWGVMCRTKGPGSAADWDLPWGGVPPDVYSHCMGTLEALSRHFTGSL